MLSGTVNFIRGSTHPRALTTTRDLLELITTMFKGDLVSKGLCQLQNKSPKDLCQQRRQNAPSKEELCF